MNSRLDRIQNWSERAHTANYCVHALAKQVGVSMRTLERFKKLEKGKCPHDWLNEMRMHQALELLRDNSTVKEVKDKLGYKQVSHFSREFHRFYGFPPSRHADRDLQPQNVVFR